MLDRLGGVEYYAGMTKRPTDVNQLAKNIVDIATGNAPKPPESIKNPAAVALGRLGGLKGGQARAKALTDKQKSDIAKKGAKARWGEK